MLSLYLQRRLELEAIKRIPLIDFLESLGHEPVKVTEGKAWYLSPLRKEKIPSFVVYLSTNSWYDFGINKGGTIIDFVMEYFNMDYVEAVAMLRKRFNPES
jgi:DNA primase